MPRDRIPKPATITSPQYLARYGENQWKRFTGRPPNRAYRAQCAWCRKEGVLAYDLLHRGAMRRSNLLCDDCYHDNH